MLKFHRSFWASAVLLTLVFALPGCLVLTGDGDSNSAPIADGGPDQVIRSQAEVILSGRNSTDTDGVLQSFQWKQVSGPVVTLIKASNSTAKFTVPRIYTATTLEFELTVTDDNSATGTTRVKVFAQPPVDADRFLTFLDVPGMFKVVAATPNTSSSQAAGQAFSVNVETRIDYSVYVDGIPQPRTKTTTQTATGTWPATGSGGENKDDYRNLWYTFNLPKVNLEDLRSGLADNERLYGTERNALLVTANITLSAGGVVTYLYVLDQAGNIINQKAGTPVATLSFSSSDGSLNSLFAQQSSPGVAIADAESQRAAAAYNKALDVNDKKTTLSAWKTVNGFVDGDPNTVEATYINGFDLGFARRMFMRKDSFGNVYAYVINAPNLEAAASNVNIIAAVAMEYSPADGALPNNASKFTKFYTFVPNPKTGEMDRVTTMDFDGRGEKYQPGTCATCHGGRAAQPDSNGNYPNSGNIGAHFLPFDVSSFYFSDADFEQRLHKTPPSTAQSEAFRRFNEMVLLTNPTAAVRELIHGWYSSNDLTSNMLPTGATFNANFVPAGWRPGTSGGNPVAGKAEDASTLYRQVVGPFCRACHTQQSGASFATYDDFMNAKNRITDLVFDRGVMPLARHTMDDFWRSNGSASAAQLLATQLGIDTGVHMPGRPLADVQYTQQGTTVRLHGADSRFADPAQIKWTLSYEPPAGRPSLTSTAALVGNGTYDPAFAMDVPGTYTVTLTVSNASGLTAASSTTITNGDAVPVIGNDTFSGDTGQTLDLAVLRNVTQFGDQPSTLTITAAPAAGTAIVDARGTADNITDDTIRYTPNNLSQTTPYSDQFTIKITDRDGSFDTAVITVNGIVNAAGDLTPPSVPTLSLVRNVNSPGQVTLSWVASNDTGGAGFKHYEIFRAMGGTVTSASTKIQTITNAATTQFVDSVGTHTTYSYGIRAVDNNNNISSLSTGTVTTYVSYTNDIHGIFSTSQPKTGGGSAVCTSCHDGVSLSGGLRFDQGCTVLKSRVPSVVDTNDPGASRILIRPGTTAMGGGPFTNFQAGGSAYNLLFAWITQGAVCN